MGASHGWAPVDTHSTPRADFGPEDKGSSNHRHITSPNVEPNGEGKVPHFLCFFFFFFKKKVFDVFCFVLFFFAFFFSFFDYFSMFLIF